MAYDKKQFLDLLLEYRSDETKKARRNVSVVAFVILSTWFLNLHLSNMNVLGMNVSPATEIPVLLVATVLLLYWTGMFVLASMQDSEIQKERSLILDDHMAYLITRQAAIEKAQKVPDSYWALSYQDHQEVKAAVDAYRLQQNRTTRAQFAVKWIRRLEFVVPLVLSGSAMLALARLYINAL